MTEHKLYDRLGLTPEADLDAIKRAYRDRVKVAHPDRGGDPAKFQEIQQAFEVLSDPDRRRRYDRNGATSDRDVLQSISEDLRGAILDGGHQDHILEPLRELKALSERLAHTLGKISGHAGQIDDDLSKLVASDQAEEMDELIAALKVMQSAAVAQKGATSSDLTTCKDLIRQYETAKEILGRAEPPEREDGPWANAVRFTINMEDGSTNT